MTHRLTKGDRVVVVDADDPNRNRTGIITFDDGLRVPYFVQFDNAQNGDGDWFREEDVAHAAHRPTAPGEHAPEAGQAIHVQRRHAILLEQPVSPDDLARAARALEPGMHVSVTVHPHTGRMEVVGTDPEDDRG